MPGAPIDIGIGFQKVGRSASSGSRKGLFYLVGKRWLPLSLRQQGPWWQLVPMHVVKRPAIKSQPVGTRHFYIMGCRAAQIGHVIRSGLAFCAPGVRPTARPIGHLARGQHRPGCQHGARFNHRTIHDHGSHADKGTVANGAGMDQRTMTSSTSLPITVG